MIRFLSGMFKARPDIIDFQIWKIRQNFSLRNTGCQQIQHIFNPDPHSANARPSATLLRIKSNAIR